MTGDLSSIGASYLPLGKAQKHYPSCVASECFFQALSLPHRRIRFPLSLGDSSIQSWLKLQLPFLATAT